MKKLISLLMPVLLLWSACRTAGPPLNWDQSDATHIDKNLSLKGGDYGYRVIIWQSAKGTYSKDTVDNYATGKNWVRVNDGDKDNSSISWFNSTYQDAVHPGHPEGNPNLPFSFDNGTVYTYTYMTNTWMPGKKKIWKVYLWISEDEDRMCALPEPQFGYYIHQRRK